MEPNWRNNELGFGHLLALGSRALPFVSRWAAIGLVAGLVVLGVSPAKYTAETTLLLSGNEENVRVETLFVDLDTHANLIRSDAIVAKVLRNLDLAEQYAPNPGPILTVLNFFREAMSRPPLGVVRDLEAMVENAERRAAEATTSAQIIAGIPGVRRHLVIKRSATTRLLSVQFTARNAENAALIANAFADVYTDHLANVSDRSETIDALPRDGKLSIDLNQEQVELFPNPTGVFNELEIASRATPPVSHSAPKVGPTLIVFTIFGFLLGAILMTYKEWRARS